MQVVIFDLFETLITERYTTDREDPEALGALLGVDYDKLRSIRRTYQNKRFCGQIDFRTAMRESLKQLGAPIAESAIQQIYDERVAKKEAILQTVESRIFEMLDRIRLCGKVIGLISNADEEEIVAWGNTGLAKRIDAAVFSCQVGWMKPDLAIYEHACEVLKVKPSECVYVGDGSSEELLGAERAGMTPIWARWYHDTWPGESKQTLKIRETASRYQAAISPEDLIGRICLA